MSRWSRTRLTLCLLILVLGGWLLARSSAVQALIAPPPVFSPICDGPGLQPSAPPSAPAVAQAQPGCSLAP